MPAGNLARLADDVLRQYFGPRALAAGRVLAQARLASVTHIAAGSLHGSVRAGGSSQHDVAIAWEHGHVTLWDDQSPWDDEPAEIVWDECTCPRRGSCEHVVAVILAARAGASPRTWRNVLAPVAELADRAAEPGRQLAVRFTVRVPQPSRWDRSGVPRPGLRLFPLGMGKKGTWIKSGASWRELASGYSSTGSQPVAQQRRALVALCAACVESHYYAPAELDPATGGPAVWFHLEQARRAGVELLDEHERPGRVVIEEQPATFGLELTRSPDGGAVLAPCVRFGETGVRLPDKRAGLVGDHGAFWCDDGGVLHLAPLKSPVSTELAALAQRDAVSIPAADLDEFRSGTGIRLARVAEITAEDESIAPRVPEPPRLALRVRQGEGQRTSLRWGFRYGESTIRPLAYDGSVDRDRPAERQLLTDVDLARLPVLRDLLADPAGRPLDAVVAGAGLIDLASTAVPWLTERGVDVAFADGFPELRESTADPVVTIRVDDDPDTIDWYELGVTVTLEDEAIAFVQLFTALAHHQDRLLLPSGTWLRLDRPEFDQLRRLIDEARALADHDRDPERLRINRFQSDLWEEFARLGVIERQSRRWSAAMAAMKSVTAVEPVPVPADIRATLRPYQADGFAWLSWLHQHRLGGILADDMGLGKTLQTLALFSRVRESKPDARFLVVAPTSVVGNWQKEAQRFAAGLDVETISQTQARRGTTVADAVGDAAVVVTSYTLLRLEFEQYQDIEWEIVVLDEAQFVKNRQSRGYQCARRLDAVSKIAMTGTPLENSVMDLWSLLSITAPGLYPHPDKFAEVYGKPVENGSAPERLGQLRRRIAPLMRRRTKEQVLADLPPKTEQELTLELGAKHRSLYQTRLQRERQKVLGLIDDMNSNRFQIFRSLTMLRQLAIDPALVSDEHERVGSAKLDQLVSQLTEVALEGHRALVFSQFTRFLARVKDRLDAAGIEYCYLDGKTRNRAKVINGFKEGDAPAFLISLKSGGFGLNLTEADYCFVLDPWWNPATELQAVDRTHRIGQDKPVTVYRYVSAGTIEEKVMELKARKQAIFNSVVGDDEKALAGALTADDIRGLLG